METSQTWERTPELRQAIRRGLDAFIQSVRNSDGFFPAEADDKLNSANVDLIEAFRVAGGGTCVLGLINLHTEEARQSPMWEHTGEEPVYTFSCAFVIPRHDVELLQMIRERHEAPYAGTKDDGVRIYAISDRIEALGGHMLAWS